MEAQLSRRITKKQTGYHLDKRRVALPMVSVSYIVEDDRLTDLQVICERVNDEFVNKAAICAWSTPRACRS